jgi:hypothetical protein
LQVVAVTTKKRKQYRNFICAPPKSSSALPFV